MKKQSQTANNEVRVRNINNYINEQKEKYGLRHAQVKKKLMEECISQ